jgi:hypothetical protein
MFKTTERMKQNFFWAKMDEEVRDYVRSCDVCQRDKVSRHKRYRLLQPLEIPYRPWTSISMDFITTLPESDGYTQIWVIVDQLTKMAHFIPLRTKEESPVVHSFSMHPSVGLASSRLTRSPQSAMIQAAPSKETWKIQNYVSNVDMFTPP